MRMKRLSAVGAMLLAALVCTAAARADVLEQVPGDALVVLKVKNLEDASKKIAKWAKDLGLDQQDPAWADPLGALSDKAHLGKGVKRDGDMAIAILDPDQFGGMPDKAVVVVVPVSDYKVFLANFKSSADVGDGISKAMPQEGNKEVFVANFGHYAAVSPNKDIVAKKPTGLMLTGFAAKESEAKDAIVFANVKVLRGKALPELKKSRQQALDAVDNLLASQQNGKKYSSLAKAVINQVMSVAEEFLNDATSATMGLSITDAGVGMTLAADFEPTSYLGKLALETKGTSDSLLAGLPGRQYFMFGGSQMDPKVAQRIISDFMDPIVKELGAVDDTKKFATTLAAASKAWGSMTGSTVGVVAPKGNIGEESMIQEVMVSHGDAKAIHDAQLQVLASMNDLTHILPQQQMLKTSFELKQNAKTVGGVSFDAFETKMNFSDEDPQAAQVKQMMAFVYGPSGMTGVLGMVDDKTILAVQGGSDELLTDAVTAAKTNADNLGATAGVRSVAAALPKERSMAGYLDLGTIANTALRYAKGFGAGIDVKIPADLPPVGMTAGADGTAFRMDIHVPNRLVQGMVSAMMEFQRSQNQPKGSL